MNTVPPHCGGAPTRRRPLTRALFGAGVLAATLAIAPAAEAKKIYVGTPGGDRIKAKSSSGDILWGGGGADTLIGGSGPDVIYGVRSNNKITGAGGDDYIEGGAGSDSIDGGAGNNTIFGSSGHDVITAGDGNNYVDVGGAPDKATLGNGNNVLHTGAGGGTYKVGNGNNVVYYGSGPATIEAGSGANTFFLSGTAALRKLDCGGNPNSVVYVNSAGLGQYSLQIFQRDKAKNCATITTYDGQKRLLAKQASKWGAFNIIGTETNDKLLGGHGGGNIEGKGGDDEIWADYNEDTGGAQARSKTTRVDGGSGNNRIFGGRGTNVITAGDGDNFVRAGAHNNQIVVGSGANLIRLQGAKSTNRVTIVGRGTRGPTFVESLANGKKPVIRCTNGAQAVVVYGNTKPKSNCRPMHSARSKKGQELSVKYTPGVPASIEIVENPIAPGMNGIGVPRPNAG